MNKEPKKEKLIFLIEDSVVNSFNTLGEIKNYINIKYNDALRKYQFLITDNDAFTKWLVIDMGFEMITTTYIRY